MWIDLWHEMLGKVVSSLPLEEQDQLVKTVADYVKSYHDPENSAINGINTDDILLPDGVLQVNLGVPVMVICCKSDLIWSVDKNRDQNERILDSVLKALREFCVTYGASLFYTSTKSAINVNVIYDYIMHRLYGFPFKHKPQIMLRDQIFVPAGWDSPNLIKQTDYLGNEKQLHDYLQKPKNKISQKELIPVTSDQDFLMQLKEKIETGRKTRKEGLSIMLQRPNPGGEVVTTAVEHVQETTTRGPQVKLQEFYQMLLDKGNKEAKDN